MKLSAICALLLFIFSVFCHTSAAFDKEAKLEELKTLQAAMNQARDEQNLTEAKRIAGEINKLVAEFEAAHAQSRSVAEATHEPEPVLQQTEQPAPAAESPEPAPNSDQASIYEKDIARLVKVRDSEKAQAVEPVKKRFDLGVQQLLRKAMQTGNLEAANINPAI